MKLVSYLLLKYHEGSPVGTVCKLGPIHAAGRHTALYGTANSLGRNSVRSYARWRVSSMRGEKRLSLTKKNMQKKFRGKRADIAPAGHQSL